MDSKEPRNANLIINKNSLINISKDLEFSQNEAIDTSMQNINNKDQSDISIDRSIEEEQINNMFGNIKLWFVGVYNTKSIGIYLTILIIIATSGVTGCVL